MKDYRKTINRKEESGLEPVNQKRKIGNGTGSTTLEGSAHI